MISFFFFNKNVRKNSVDHGFAIHKKKLKQFLNGHQQPYKFFHAFSWNYEILMKQHFHLQ